MKEQIAQIEGALKANEQETNRTPWLDLAANDLRAALANSQGHVAELGRRLAQKQAQLAADQAALDKLKSEVASEAANQG